MSFNQPNASRPLGEYQTIETPEQTRLDFSVAGLGTRFLALTIDYLIQGAAALVLFIGAVILGISGVLRSLPFSRQWVVALLIALSFLLHFAYFIGFEIFWSGQTPGKRLTHIRVIKDSGRPLSVSETIGRNLIRLVDQLPAFYALGILSMLLTTQNKRLGDLIAGSIVVREASLAELRPVWHSEPAAEPLWGPGIQQLSADDFDLIDAFLSRRKELPAHVRSRIAAEILERIRPKLSIGIDSGVSVESLLETIAYQRRSESRY